MQKLDVPGVNARTEQAVTALIADAAALRLGVDRLANGTTIIDAGIGVPGGVEAGRRIAEICMGGLGRIAITAGSGIANWPWQLEVGSSNPVIACLASQYAGWSLSHGEGKEAFYALGSGPARAMGSKEPLFAELQYRETHDKACLILEVDKIPPVEIADKVAEYCGISAQDLSLILTPTTSLSGAVQVVARVLEVALHKVHELEFPLNAIVDGAGSAPLCPPAGDFMTAMGRTNDAIIFAGRVHLYVACSDSDAEALAGQLPSAGSQDFGRPFAQIFKDYDYDFYKVDKLLFSPAEALVTSVKSGRSFRAGSIREDLLEQSFAG